MGRDVVKTGGGAPALLSVLVTILSFLKYITDGVIHIVNRATVAKTPWWHIAVTEYDVLAGHSWRLPHYWFPSCKITQVLRRGNSRVMAATACQNIQRLTGVRA